MSAHIPVNDLLAPDWGRREELVTRAFGRVQEHLESLPDRPASPERDGKDIRERLSDFDFDKGVPTELLIDTAAELMGDGNLHCAHPRYLGLFNPAPAFPGIVADLMTAAYNPNLACWTHAPASVEIEAHLVRTMGELFGFPAETAAGHFTSGGTEANATALVCALTRCFPAYAERGLAGASRRPAVYASADSHLAWLKIAHQCGIGRDAVRLVPTDAEGKLDDVALQSLIARDRLTGYQPVLIVGTAGTTSAGMIDPLPRLAAIARDHRAHFHVDAAWGGAAIFSARLRACLTGIELADSITIDAHKWLAVPMGAGMFLCRENGWLETAFGVSTSYMPPNATDIDGYTHSMQWSRRFIGLKLFMTLGTLGKAGYASMIEQQAELGNLLRDHLISDGWRLVNDTPLPVICFDREGVDVAAIADHVVESGQAWISTTNFLGRPVLRACISNTATTEQDLCTVRDLLAQALSRTRSRAAVPA